MACPNVRPHRVLAGPGFNEANHRNLLRNVRDKMPPSLTYHVRIVERLAMTRAGKTPFVIRRIDTPEAVS